MAWTTPTTRTTGTLITASIWNTDLVDNLIYLKGVADQVDGFNTKVKAADQTIVASTTLQNDTHISWAVTANKMYGFRATIYVNTPSAAPEFKCGWTYPTGATMLWTKVGKDREAVDGVTALTESQTDSWSWAAAMTTQLHFAGVAFISSTAGTLQWQWAQAIASGTTTVLKGSFLTYYLLD